MDVPEVEVDVVLGIFVGECFAYVAFFPTAEGCAVFDEDAVEAFVLRFLDLDEGAIAVVVVEKAAGALVAGFVVFGEQVEAGGS